MRSTPVNSFPNARTEVWRVLLYMANLQSVQRPCVRKGKVESHLQHVTPAVLEIMFIMWLVVTVSECWTDNTVPRWIGFQNIHAGFREVFR